jgi:hypothetical protein
MVQRIANLENAQTERDQVLNAALRLKPDLTRQLNQRRRSRPTTAT